MVVSSTPLADTGTSAAVPAKMAINAALEELQTDEQRYVLDVVTQVRKCGLDSILSLPQIVVCGDQSAGKSSVLEALTEIPFPRNDNLCTRFATEISLRREAKEKLTVKVIPDASRPAAEQERIKGFSESITDFSQLPIIMNAAMKVMDISDNSETAGSAFAKDTLSIAIDGPNKPQLTLVDIPGLIQASTKGVSPADVAMVAEITEYYISQPRTICLAVISATNDAANQPILERVRKFDPEGQRTLGVITKSDMLPEGSGSEVKFLQLARNEDVYFKLGWHVIRNRKFEERHFSFGERNATEVHYFRTSNFKVLPKETVGIDALRIRLSQLLFEHVKNELPRLKLELEVALKTSKDELNVIGASRSNIAECRAYLAQLSMDFYEICKAGLHGNYQDNFFKIDSDNPFSTTDIACIVRLRAVVQHANSKFAQKLRTNGHKYNFTLDDPKFSTSPLGKQRTLSKKESMAWVQRKLLRSRGTELLGNFNPHLVTELFWEQSEPWEKIAREHIEQISEICGKFLSNLLEQRSPRDVKSRIWSFIIRNILQQRQAAAFDELEKLIDDKRHDPINYNHYYTDNIHKCRQRRLKSHLEDSVISISQGPPDKCSRGEHYYKAGVTLMAEKIMSHSIAVNPDMERFTCEEALDCLLAIYKVQQKTFIANVTTQAIERHIVQGLDGIFSPMVVVSMTDTEVESIASEPVTVKRHRSFLVDRINKLESGHESFRGVMQSS